MKETRIIMNMPITVDIVGCYLYGDLDNVFKYFESVEKRFSPFSNDSEVALLNKYGIENFRAQISEDMAEVLEICERTRKESCGYFNIVNPDGKINPSGVVKGWAILKAATMLKCLGYENFFVDAGGDIQANGKNEKGCDWKIGIRNPFNTDEIIKIICPRGTGVATSGTYVRGKHIYNPLTKEAADEISSITVIAKDILEADRIATASFAMGKNGIQFLEEIKNCEGYMIDKNGIATMTSRFDSYTES